MRDAVAAIEAALKELIDARNALPDDFASEIDAVITQTQILLDSLVTGDPRGAALDEAPQSTDAEVGPA
jgi:hypothetical protein